MAWPLLRRLKDLIAQLRVNWLTTSLLCRDMNRHLLFPTDPTPMTTKLCNRGVTYSHAVLHVYRGVAQLAPFHHEMASPMVLGALINRRRPYVSARTGNNSALPGQGLARQWLLC